MAGARNPWEENYGSNDGQDSGAKPWEQAYQQPEPPKARTLGAVANDTVIEVANAAAGGVSSAANFIKPGNAVSGWIDKNIVKAGEDSQSDVTKAAKKQFRDEVENADGVMGELGAVGKYVVQNPLLSAAQAAGSFVGPGIAVKAVGFAGKAAQLGAKGVERAGRAGGVAAGAAMAGGDAAGTAYELSTKAGATEDQAVAAGRQASVIPAVIGGVGGMFGAEKLLAGAKGFAGGATSRALKTGASEAVQEGIEEGATQYEGQRAAMPYDPSIDPSKGVAAAAGMGAALGGITGAGASLLTGRDTGQQPNPGTQTPPVQTQPAPDNSMAAVREQWLAHAQQLREAETGEALPPQTTAPDGAALLAAQRAQQEQARLAEQAQNRALETADDEIYQSTGFADRAPVQRPSEAMGLDPNVGSMSAAAALAVDSGATDQLAQIASAQAQAELDAKDGKGAKKPSDKGALESAATLAAPAVDADGVIADVGPAVYPTYEDAHAYVMNQRRNGASVTGLPVPAEGGGFTVAMRGTPEYQQGEALRAERMQAERQAKASAKQQEKAPLAQDTQALQATNIVAASANLKSITAKQIPAMTDVELQQAIEHYGPEHKRTAKLQKEVQRRAAETPTPTTGAFDGPQADQTQQASAQPAQAAAAPDATAGLTNGTTAPQNPGAQAAPAGGTQGKAPRATAEQLTGAQERWQRMTTAERQAVAARTDVKPILRKNLHGAKWENLNVDVQRKLQAAMEPIEAQPSDLKAFKPETGTLGVPRSEMPQVPSQSHGGLVKHLNSQGISHETTTVDAGSLKPTQAEYSPAKVEAAKGAEGGRAVIVSNDGHIIDGHHQAMAAAEEGKPVKAIVLDAPVDKALDAVRNSPSASLQEAVIPAAPSTADRDQDRNGLTAEDRRLQHVDSNASELARQIANDAIDGDMDAAEVLPALRQWAKDNKLADDELRVEVLKRIRAGDGLTAKQIASIEKALSPVEELKRAEKVAAKTKPASDKQFAGNKIFTADAVAAARERMKKKLGTLNSGLDPELMMDGMTIAGAYIESGVRSFGQYAKAMVADMGDGVKPYLLSFWEAARNYPGVDTNGMTSVEESAREHADLITPQVRQQAAEAIGEEAPTPARRTKKTGVRGDMVLTQDWGVEHINGYGDTSREEGNDTKDAFLKEARNYLNAVAAQLEQSGFASHAGRNGKTEKAVSVNESGMAGSGDVSLTMQHPDTGLNVYVTIGDTSLRGMVPSTASGIAIMYRTATGSDRYAAKGGNTWAPVDLSATDLALLVSRAARSTIDNTSRAAGSTDTKDATNSGQNGRGADQGRAPEVSGRRGSSDDSAAPADSGNLEAGQPQDVPAPAESGRSGGDGVRVPGADVGGKRPTGEGGDAANGRTRTGRARAPDAGAGSRPSVKAPEEVSPANPGAGNFHIENPLEIVGGGQVARFDKNQAAIDLLNAIREDSRQATAEEQRVLAGYTGWGSFGQELFQGTWEKPMPKDGWQARDKWLREHLGEDEWKSAQRSITNAHYTDPPTVTAMWDMAKRMGFTGGRVLEPSMGIGNFFGMMPADLKARSQLSGIELDSLTGAMAKLLYPDANVKIMGYQDSKTPDDFHDVVIGNWPFENTTIADRRYNSLSPFLHDYFFLKAVDQVRPGGLVIGITSHGTMDKKATRIRAALAKKAELVSAIRLPSGAFQEYAGTKVVTDIVILRKREQPLSIVPSDPWINSVAYKTPAGPEVFINEYYVANPGNVIGTTDFGHGTTRMQPGMIVHRPENMAERLRAAVELVPEGAYKKAERAKHITYITNHTADREGALTLQDGQLMVVRGEHLAPAEQVRSYKVKSAAATAQREKELRALIDMRSKYAALIEADRGGADATAQRTALREAYEAFTTEHGPLGDSFGLNYLKRIDDPFRPALAALEVNGRPSAILTGSTMRGAARMENPTAQDAYVLARNTAVEPTIEEIAALAKKPADQVKAALLQSGAIFETPAGDIVPSDIYLSGNVREKLRQAQAALEDGNQAMQRNVDELSKVVPKDIPYFNIESQLGATWVPPKTYAAYVAHMLNMPDGDAIGVTFINGRWKVKLPDGANRRAEASTGFGTSHYPFSKLVNAAMSNQTVKIRRKDSSGNEYLDTEATDEANGKISDIRAKFGEWLWSDPERRVAQEREYNEVRNAYATPKYDGSFLAFEGMALSVGRGPFNLREHQVNAIWRALVNRRSLNGHEVGTGKTFTMGGIAVESRRYGIAKKPMILAHNANSASVAAEIQQMYPGAKLLYIDNLTPDTIAVKMRQIANDDWDAIVVPHSLIDRLSFREETLMAMAQEDIRSLEEEAYAAAEDDGVTITAKMLEDDDELKKLRSVTAKELVKARNRIIESIKDQAMRSSKEGAIPFEELGIDMVLVDEVHEFKKPPISTRMNMKGLNTQTSNRSIALQFITRYIRANNNGGNVHTFTGTPITNTLTEIFHQMRYVMEDEMKAAGVDTWDGWFGSFAKEVQDVELSAAGEYEAVTRLAGFINVPELRRMIGQYMDVVFADDMPEMQPRRVNGKTMASADLTEAERAELLNGRTEGAMDRPYKKVVNVTSDLTPEQKTIFARLQGYARTWRSMTGKQRKEAMAAGAPESPIITEGMANKASFDVRLTRDDEFAGQEGTAPDDPGSKASKVIANVLEIYRSSPDAAQVIFAEQGYSTSQKRSIGRDAAGNKQYRTVKTFSTMRDIVARLVAQGIPAEQIAMVDGSTSKEKRKEIADAMNALRIRVVIGSTDTLGVGVNMQRNLRAMHHMDAPYMPGELEQRNGRGLRQGNQWNTVLEYRYMTDRLDGRRWQILAIKQRFITAFLKSNSATRVIEGDAAADEDSDILQSFSEAAGDPRILIREKLSKNVEALKRAERLHTNGVADAIQAIRRTNDSVAWARKRLADMTANNLPGRVRELLQSQAANYRATVDGTQYDSRAEAEDAMQQSLQDNVRMENVNVPMGTYGGQAVTASWPALQNTPHLTITMGNQEFTSTSLRGLEAQLRGLPGRIEKVEQEIASKAGSISRMEEVAAAPFARAADLERAKKQFDALVADIAANPVPPPAWLRAGAPVESAAFRNGKEFLVTGHRWNADGWFVLAQDAKGEVAIPFAEVTDAQGMPVYEPREFEAPEVHTKEPKVAPAASAPADQVDANDDDVQFSRSKMPVDGFTPAARKQAVQAVEKTAAAIRSAWANGPEVVVAFDMNDPVVPDSARRADLKQRSGGARGAPEGFYYRGKVYLMASRLNTPADAARVLFHEALGHHGLRGAFGGSLAPILNQIATMRKKDVDAKIREYGLRGVNSLDRRAAAEEVLAEMAQNTPTIGFVRRAVAAIRTWLRKNVPGFGSLRMTDNEIIRNFILPARQFVERGGPGGGGVRSDAAFSRGVDDGPMFSRSGGIGEGMASRMGSAIKSVTATNIKERAGWKAADWLGIGLQLLGRRQLVDVYGDALPLDTYDKLAAQMEADKNEVGAGADELATAWSKLKDERQLAELMHEATLAQIDPSKDLVGGDDPARYQVLKGRFDALTPEAKKVYLDARDAYQGHHENVRRAIKERIERSELKGERKAELLKQMDDEFFKAVKGVYFPLARFGQYVVVVKDSIGKVASVNRAETMPEAQALRKSMLDAFPASGGYTVAKPILSKEFLASRDSVGRGFMTELYQVLDKQDMDVAARAELEDTLGQLYLSSLPDLSWAKHGIHRKGTAGFSQNARRAYAQNMFHGARYLAKLRYSDLMQDELTAMQKHVDDWRDVDAFDQPTAQRVVDEFNKRHESLMNPNGNPISTALTSFGFIFHMGLSPASAMVNLTQTALVAYPVMGAKWGFDKSAAALLRASKDAVKGKNDITKSLTSEERQAYEEAVRTGVIDVTMAHDLAGIAQGEDAGVMWKLRPVMKAASFMFHHAERFNRQVTFVASYRLARETGAQPAAAFEQAAKATYDGHFDYSAGNRPRVMQGNAAKVLLLFKQYGQNMVYTIARSAYQSFKGDTPAQRSEARKALAGLLTMHGMAAGALGLPMVTTLLAAASMLGGSDDEPWDAQVALQNMLADTFGQKPAEVLAHGLSRLTPWDISGRVGLDKLIFPDVQEGLEGQRLAESAMTAALGPVAGIGVNVLKGVQAMGEGQYLRGLENMLPTVLRGPMKAIRYESEGVKDKSGIVIADEVGVAGLLGQSVGFSPSDVRNAYEGKSAVVQYDRALQARRSALVEQFAMASMAGDAEGAKEAREDIEKFNAKNPGRRILPLQLIQSVHQREKRIREAQDGVYLPQKRKDALDQGRFATGG